MPSTEPINIVVPLAGRGVRFKKEGYEKPKPLINILGKPMILWVLTNLKFQPDDELFIAYLSELKPHGFEQLIRNTLPGVPIHFIGLEKTTSGAATTLLSILREMNDLELKRKTISLDCDTIYFSDVLQEFRDLDKNHGCCCYFVDKRETPIFSYIETDEKENIIRIAEKKKISHKANTGAYGFENGKILTEYVRKLLNAPIPTIGEYYTSEVINNMVNDGVKFKGIAVERFECVGTPEQLREFIHKRTKVLEESK